MGRYFGTDGFRGEANINLTADHAYQVGRFLGWYYNEKRAHAAEEGRPVKEGPARIVIGKDTRRSSYMFEYSLVAGLVASGADAYMLHVTTTPSVAYIARVDDFDCGIMISASHNPYFDNGIKLINDQGEKMDEETIELVEDCLDVYTYDSYPNFAFAMGADPRHNTTLNDRKWGKNLMEVRSVCPHFGIMEQQSGGGGWQTRMPQPAPRPGQMRLWAMQSIAHGADYISFFRWRTCSVGTEIYWNGILDWDNRDTRRLQELREIHKETEKLSSVVGSRYQAKIALAYHYATEWDGEADIFHGPLDGVSVMNWFAACQTAHAPMDLLCLRDQLTLEQLLPYELLILPHISLLSDMVCDVLKAYLEQGGKIIFGARTGYKDEYGRCPMRPAPGGAASLIGGTVKEYTLVPEGGGGTASYAGKSLPMPLLNEVLEASGGEVLAVYEREYYAGQPPILCRRVGQGEAVYVGSAFSEELAAALLCRVGLEEPYAAELELPPEVELAVRVKGDKVYRFLLNYTAENSIFTCKKPLADVLSGLQYSGRVTLPPYGVMVLTDL